MRHTIIPRDQAAANLSISREVLIRYEARGLVRLVREGEVEGYDPAEIRRLWTIVSFQRDLGINLAGVETILRLRDRLEAVSLQMHRFSIDLRQALDDVEAVSDDAEDAADAP